MEKMNETFCKIDSFDVHVTSQPAVFDLFQSVSSISLKAAMTQLK